MIVYFITDEFKKTLTTREMVDSSCHIAPLLVGSNARPTVSGDAVVVDVDLRKPDHIEEIRVLLDQLGDVSQKLFVVDRKRRLSIVQAYALGATHVVADLQEALLKLTRSDAFKTQGPARCNAPSGEMIGSATSFASMFSSVLDGKPIRLSDAHGATMQIIEGVAQHGLTSWLDDVRKYHEGTFQHCLLVTGIAAGFAMRLNFSSQDVQQLALAATLHDIGKASIPIEILDKPGPLDALEKETIRRHPVIGFDALKDVAGIDAEVLGAVRHHHEFLDGSGYPDALTAPNISDLVRLLTISDIFAALIEVRSYKPPMPRQKAYGILCEMNGKLEMPLVHAFKHVALVG